MGFAFTAADAGVGEAVRRVAREEAEGALAAVGGDGPLEPRVHEMRKGVKKLRGLLRLVRPVLREAGAENAALRDAGRGLSGLRDAAVMLGTAQQLAEGLAPARREALLGPFRAAAAEADARAGGELLPPFAAAMEGVRARSGAWALRREGWAALEPGLRATWRAARRAMRAAEGAPTEDALHEWRKRVKDHWYQARLLEPLWPETMRPHVAAADELGELLGQANDLAVLRARVEGMGLEPGLLWEVRDRAEARHAELMEAARPLGRRLLAGSSRALAGRWGAWWALRGA